MKAVDILVLDDGDKTFNDVKRLFEPQGFRISKEADPAKAGGLLRAGGVRVIISSHAVSGTTGVGFLKEARALCPTAATILLTDHTSPEIATAVSEGLLILTPGYKDIELLSIIFEGARMWELKEEVNVLREKIAALPGQNHQHKKILVIDDEERISDLIRIQLTRQGHEVITAGDGMEGLDRLKEVEPALIILDVNMPRMNGIDFFRHILDDKNKPRYPVLVLTSRERLEEVFRDAEAEGFLPKPFEVDDLLREVKRILAGAKVKVKG